MGSPLRRDEVPTMEEAVKNQVGKLLERVEYIEGGDRRLDGEFSGLKKKLVLYGNSSYADRVNPCHNSIHFGPVGPKVRFPLSSIVRSMLRASRRQLCGLTLREHKPLCYQ
jgi:hypothetical protein